MATGHAVVTSRYGAVSDGSRTIADAEPARIATLSNVSNATVPAVPVARARAMRAI